MTTTAAPRTIRATIAPDAISRVPSFFDAGLSDIYNELFQNARRAGASQVEITSTDQYVTVSDDGAGIADPQDILSFGGSNWDNPAVTAEHPAGMGFYALARRPSVTVRSAPAGQTPWQVKLSPEHFTGEQAAVVHLADGAITQGTQVTFAWSNGAQLTPPQAAVHYPLPVTLNGITAPQADFLADYEYVTEWQGLRIGVKRQVRQPLSWQPDPRRINFHGIVIDAANYLPSVPTIDPNTIYFASVDVVQCPHLELTLPARKQLVQTDFIKELRQASKSAIYRAIAAADPPVGVPKEYQRNAAAMGIDIPDAPAQLKPWRPDTEWASSGYARHREPIDATPDSLVVEADLPINEQHTLMLAAYHSGIDQRLVAENDAALSGYSWYDGLSRISAIHTVAIYDDQEFEIDGHGSMRHASADHPDEIQVILMVTSPAGEHRQLTLRTDVAMVDEEYSLIEELNPLIAQNADLSIAELADHMMAAYFSFYEDKRSDSYHTQERRALQEARLQAIAILQSEKDAVIQRIQEAASRAAAGMLPAGSVITISVADNGALQVAVA